MTYINPYSGPILLPQATQLNPLAAQLGLGAPPTPIAPMGVQVRPAGAVGLGGAEALAEQAAGAAAPVALNKAGSLLARAGVPERFLGSFYLPGAIGGTIAGIAGHPIGSALGNWTGNQKLGDVTGDVLADAGTGAALGSAVGPWGTLAGGLLGGAYGAFSGMNKPEKKTVEDQATQFMQTYGIDAQTQGKIRATYEQLKQADEQTANAWLQQVVGQAQQQWAAGAGNPFGTQNQLSSDQYLQMQQLSASLMAPYVNSMKSNYDAAGKALTDNMGNLTQAQQDQLKPLVQQYTNLSKNVADAYALQAQAYPIQNALAKSSWAAMLQNYTGGGSGSGLSSLISQATAPTAGG